MTVDRYIGELLFDYECVILPGLGGFISNKKPASVNMFTHQFQPPYYQLFFNVHLTENDGLLIDYIARRKSAVFAEARAEVEEYVRECRKKLEQGITVVVHDIGTLTQDASGNIYFRQDMKVNYDPDAFGLSAFVSPQIKRQTDEEKVMALVSGQKRESRMQPDRKPVSVISRKGIGRLMARAAVVILLISSISWGLMNRDNINGYLAEYATVNPFAKKNPHYEPRHHTDPFVEQSSEGIVQDSDVQLPEETLAEPVQNDIQVTDIEPDPVIAETDVAEKPVEETPMETVAAETGENVPESSKPGPGDASPAPDMNPNGYYVIAGSFESRQNAEKLVESLRARGYDARIADTNKYGMYRVAYEGAGSLQLARDRLLAIRTDDNSEAWILKK